MKQLRRGRPSTRFRRRLVEQYRMGLLSRREIWQKYEISASLLQKWNRWYYQHYVLTHRYRSLMNPKNQDEQARIAELEQKLKAAEAAYETKKLECEIYEKMMDVAERDLKIPIRKKYGAKRSRK